MSNTRKPPPPPRKKGITEDDLHDLTEEFFDLLVELNSKAKHPTPAGVRLDRMIGKALQQEQKRRKKQKGQKSAANTPPAKDVQFQSIHE